MCVEHWIRGPFGLDAERRATRVGCRTVLVMVPTIAAGSRLLDLITLLDNDSRVQTVFTVPESMEMWAGTDEFVREHGGLVVSWPQAFQHRFDAVLAASYVGLDQVRGRVLVLPHGASSLMSRAFSRSGGPTALPYTGLARETLTHRGRLIPSALALTHDRELDALRRSCPEAMPVAIVAGDICYDRMSASLHLRDDYRRSLGVGLDQQLITVSSTWSADSLFGRHPELCARLLDELPPDDYRVALVLHPSVWAVHGRWQIRAWLADCLQRGLLVIPPDEGWRATMIASDRVIGDHGSTTQYAAAIRVPVLLGTFPHRVIRPGSIADALAAVAPRLNGEQSIPAQLRQVTHLNDGAFADLITSRPGRSSAILRRSLYRLLDLAEPNTEATARPLPLPVPIRL
jgi:hypothetical protein